MNLNKLSRGLYQAARISRDINAVSRGPKAVGNRIVRKASYRGMGSMLARILNRVLR